MARQRDDAALQRRDGSGAARAHLSAYISAIGTPRHRAVFRGRRRPAPAHWRVHNAELRTTSLPPLPEIEPRELAQLIAADRAPLLLDVREPHEHAYTRLPGARLIPLGLLPREIGALPRDAKIVVYCHHGVRSAHAVDILRANGISARNLAGGIDRWSVEVDPSVRRY